MLIAIKEWHDQELSTIHHYNVSDREVTAIDEFIHRGEMGSVIDSLVPIPKDPCKLSIGERKVLVANALREAGRRVKEDMVLEVPLF